MLFYILTSVTNTILELKCPIYFCASRRNQTHDYLLAASEADVNTAAYSNVHHLIFKPHQTMPPRQGE